MLELNGYAYISDISLLGEGASCIIRVNDVNSPTGVWWGTVEDVMERDGHLAVRAVITGGRFNIDDTGCIVYSTEKKEVVPYVNYTVYPDTHTTRELFHHLLKAEAKASNLARELKSFRETFFETLERIVRVGVASGQRHPPQDEDI